MLFLVSVCECTKQKQKDKNKAKTATKFICSPFIRNTVPQPIFVCALKIIYSIVKSTQIVNAIIVFSIPLIPRRIDGCSPTLLCLDVEAVTKTDQKTSNPNGLWLLQHKICIIFIVARKLQNRWTIIIINAMTRPNHTPHYSNRHIHFSVDCFLESDFYPWLLVFWRCCL